MVKTDYQNSVCRYDGRLYLQGWFEIQLDFRTSESVVAVRSQATVDYSKYLVFYYNYEFELGNSTRSSNNG